MDGGATLVAYKEISMVIKLVIDRKLYCLKSEPKHENKELNLTSYFNSNWDGELEPGISVTGFIIYLLGVPNY
jgi:hypothetical protein